MVALCAVVVYMFPGMPPLAAMLLNLASVGAMVTGCMMAVRERRALQHDGIRYGQGFSTALAVMFYISIITAAISYIYLKYPGHDLIIKERERMLTLLDTWTGTEEQIEQARKGVTLAATPGGLSVASFIGNMFMGTIIALIVAAIVKRDKPETVGNNEDESHQN